MAPLFSALSPLTNNLILLISVILLKWLISYFSPLDTFRFFRFYCSQLANKVNKANNTQYQQKIAGLMSLLITLLTIVIILWLFESFIEVVWLWHGFLLYLAIDGFHLAAKGKAIATDLVANKKYEAKQKIKPLVLRECDNLSAMGIVKSFIEMTLLRQTQQLIIPCFYFIIAGPLMAFSYRLLLEMHYSWNTKQPRFNMFGKPALVLVNLLQWLPVRILSLMILFISLNSQIVLFWRLIRGHFFQLNNNLLIHCFALVNSIQLGGVAMYQGEKLRKTNFNQQAQQPEPKHIITTNQRMIEVKTILFSGLIIAVMLTGLIK